jgi:hypothetical protein
LEPSAAIADHCSSVQRLFSGLAGQNLGCIN